VGSIGVMAVLLQVTGVWPSETPRRRKATGRFAGSMDEEGGAPARFVAEAGGSAWAVAGIVLWGATTAAYRRAMPAPHSGASWLDGRPKAAAAR
jgi:hypothetical protein